MIIKGDVKRRLYMQIFRFTDDEENKLRLTTRQDLCRLRRRAKGNMTQEEYAKWCGVSVNLIRRVESDRPYNPDWTPEMYCKILGVTHAFVVDHIHWNRFNEEMNALIREDRHRRTV